MTSTNHHWWPEGLQKACWQDEHNRIYWIEPDGSLHCRNPANHKIGRSLRHHKIDQIDWKGEPLSQPRPYLKGANFEGVFSIDNDVHKIVELARELSGDAQKFPPRYPLVKVPAGIQISEVRWKYHDQAAINKLILFCLSLLIRSPANLSRLASLPRLANLPVNLRVGKENLRAQYKSALSLLDGSKPRAFVPTLILSNNPSANFLFADGLPDCLSISNIPYPDTSGHALVPLTPRICVYLWASKCWHTQRNYAVLRVNDEVVRRINSITQIYAKEKLFYKGDPPTITDEFRRKTHMQLEHGTDPLFDALQSALM